MPEHGWGWGTPAATNDCDCGPALLSRPAAGSEEAPLAASALKRLVAAEERPRGSEPARVRRCSRARNGGLAAGGALSRDPLCATRMPCWQSTGRALRSASADDGPRRTAVRGTAHRGRSRGPLGGGFWAQVPGDGVTVAFWTCTGRLPLTHTYFSDLQEAGHGPAARRGATSSGLSLGCGRAGEAPRCLSKQGRIEHSPAAPFRFCRCLPGRGRGGVETHWRALGLGVCIEAQTGFWNCPGF